MTIALTHIAIHVADVSACVDFYSSYAGMHIIHERPSGENRIVWLSEPGQEPQFIIVVLPGGCGHKQQMNDFSHLGFALESKEAVDRLAKRAEEEGILVWGVRNDKYPAGYYCGVKDPDGNFIEFSYGQPLGPGAPELIK
ncbi:lactoylglutathione lyase-like lyase [Shewanella psychrophila]|uniref:Lactoylglutathione lyase-like lyase n=1 Tax=Shewanella psychrophila TaxID=225848 RepID=A0A1S6HW94_9GAMM|nr:VOC family protein [Shewanella psychrophila]AQS39678.1 lactoylglutathione lyase-like lyase [Shewanella psychrophila]